MFREPRIDDSVLELGPCLRRYGNRAADLPHLVDESTRDLEGFGLECAERACARAVAKELIHLACEDPRVDEGIDRLQSKARFSHLGYCADPPEQGVAPDCRIARPSLDRRCSEVDFRGERDRVLVHARPQRFHADVGPDFRPGLQIGLHRFLAQAGCRSPQLLPRAFPFILRSQARDDRYMLEMMTASRPAARFSNSSRVGTTG
jgi:hypothetical protein